MTKQISLEGSAFARSLPGPQVQSRTRVAQPHLIVHTPEEAWSTVSCLFRIKHVICGHSKGTLLGRSPACGV